MKGCTERRIGGHLPALNKAELLAVKEAAAEGLLGPLRGANGAPATPLFEALTRAHKRARLSLDQFQATGIVYKALRRTERSWRLWMKTSLASNPNKVPYRAFIAFLVKLVIDRHGNNRKNTRSQ